MATNILALGQFAQQGFEQGKQAGLERRYNRLAGQAFNAPDAATRDAAIGQIAVNNPDAAANLRAQYQGEDDRNLKLVTGAARYMKTALDSGNAQAIAGAWRSVRPGLIRAGLATEQELSQDWQPDYEQTVHQVLAAAGGGSALVNPYEGLPSDIQSLRLLQDNPQLAALDRERRQAAGMVPKLVETAQGYGWGTPGAGISLAPLAGVAGQGGQAAAPQQDAQAAQRAQAYYQRMRGLGLTDEQAMGATEAMLADLGYQQGGGTGGAPRASGGQPAAAPAQGGRLVVMDPVNGGIAQPYQAPPSPIEQERLRLAQNADARAAAAAQQRQNKPMPPAIFKQREATLAEAETAEGINQNLDKHLQRMDRGELEFGPIANRLAEARNFAGMSDAGSRNFAEFRSDLEKLRNDSLRLNAGVQTDGDAQRAWNELFSNINDTAYVKQRLRTIRQLNERAEMLKRASVERLDQEYGGGGSAQPTTDDDEALIGKYL